ncbi:hypothetical protein SMD44_00985 [Streptomyces alboflavus]|uniref:Uncharacterized protein n=1 Tax=Streptomyces alboflavus TaxID=67267 RepID=A0A1Z1W5A7_9ACTN|nr:helix-turn-helix domain-containing protein [Streptomyces alboflavus]ARX81587.1 hypothetical protein SMD44_00985 [Streptomyces alboflavus]
MNKITDAARQQILALAAAGHSDSSIHRITGISRVTIARYRRGYTPPPPHTTADNTQCRNGHSYPDNLRTDSNGWHYCTQCRRAKAKRWRDRNPMPAQPDTVAILRAVHGDPPQRLTPRERTEAVRQLTDGGLSVTLIAARLRCHPKTVKRARRRLKAAA